MKRSVKASPLLNCNELKNGTVSNISFIHIPQVVNETLFATLVNNWCKWEQTRSPVVLILYSEYLIIQSNC